MFEELDNGKLSIPGKGKVAFVFHLPGHCAGCQKVINSLKKRPCLGWKEINLIDAENEDNKVLVNKYKITTAPTILIFLEGELVETLTGLKAFLARADELFGELDHNLG